MVIDTTNIKQNIKNAIRRKYEAKYTSEERAVHKCLYIQSKFIAVVLVVTYIAMSAHVTYYKWKNPIEYNNPVVSFVTEKQVEKIAEKKESGEVLSANYPNMEDVIDKIHLLESGRGTAPKGHHLTCKTLGLSNEFGYGALDGYCFNSYEESVKAMNMWFRLKFEDGFSLKEALCIYNTGLSKNGTCEYATNFDNL